MTLFAGCDWGGEAHAVERAVDDDEVVGAGVGEERQDLRGRRNREHACGDGRGVDEIHSR